MSAPAAPLSPVAVPQEVCVHEGPALLRGMAEGPSLAAHRRRFGPLPTPGLVQLHELVERAGLRGRGGAAFPFATKLRTAASRRGAVVVVNLSEGEPASAKDSALALTRPHLVLDGAVATAKALAAREIHVVLTSERPLVARAMVDAIEERYDRIRIRHHRAEPRFVAGQARAVVELLSGRPNLPVTSWAPEAVSGLSGRPTLLSNAETWAQLGLLVLGGEAAYRRHGTASEPGTLLLTFTTPGQVPHVLEVEQGTPVPEAFHRSAIASPAVVGGFHGSWASWSTLRGLRLSTSSMAAAGVPLGAGVVLTPPAGTCPLDLTARILGWLAGQSAGRCGPCRNGLPALAEAMNELARGRAGLAVLEELGGLADVVTGRGACAHPDGTARLARSLVAALPDEVGAHLAGMCGMGPGTGPGVGREVVTS